MPPKRTPAASQRPAKRDTRTVKRRRAVDEDESNNSPKALRRAQHTEARAAPDKKAFIEDWLEESCWSRRASPENEAQLLEVSANMHRKPAPVSSSPGNTFESPVSTSRKSEKSTTSVYVSDYRVSLSYRNIFVERENPPPELMRRAQRLISRSVQDDPEEKIIKQMVPEIIPSMQKIPDQRLEMNSGHRWFNSVPIALQPSILINPLPLPMPKPDLAFGYSEAAFTEDQLGTIDLLVDDQFGRSYAVPNKRIQFPFLQIEFKSQAAGGTHWIATNQAAGAGAIALKGTMELMERSFGLEHFDYEKPQYFSVSMDHELARINVHWVKAAAEGGQPSFHVEHLSKYLLDDASGIRAVSRAIKNILDDGADARLSALCSALDRYRATVIRDRAAGNAQRNQGHDGSPRADKGDGAAT